MKAAGEPQCPGQESPQKLEATASDSSFPISDTCDNLEPIQLEMFHAVVLQILLCQDQTHSFFLHPCLCWLHRVGVGELPLHDCTHLSHPIHVYNVPCLKNQDHVGLGKESFAKSNAFCRTSGKSSIASNTCCRTCRSRSFRYVAALTS